MSLGAVVGLFFMASALQPVIKQRMLENARERLLARIEAKRKSRMILLIYRQEIMSFLGFPLMRFPDINGAEEVMRACELTEPETPLDIVVHTPVGLEFPFLQIARAIRQRKGWTTVFVPHYAMSGATLIALAADEIVMSPHAVLGPVEPQVDRFSAVSILKAVERKSPAEVEDQTLIMAEMAERVIVQRKDSVAYLLSRSVSEKQAANLADLLVGRGQWTHENPITLETAQALGLKVNSNFPAEILQLMCLFPQPRECRQPGGFLPVS